MSTSDLSTVPSKELDLESTLKENEVSIGDLDSNTGLDTAIVNDGRDMSAWLTLIGSCLVYFATFGIINSFGFFQNYYKDHFLGSVSASTISFVGTLQVTLVNLLAAPAGCLFDCYGFKGLYIFSGIGCLGSLVCLSFVRGGLLWQIFLIQGFLLGTALAFGAQPALIVVGHHFVRRRAFVLGIVAAAGSVGGVCFPVIFDRLAKLPSVGYEWSLRVVAIIIGCCYAVALLISSARLPCKPLDSIGGLIDFRGFLDKRYWVLSIGAFFVSLGQLVPYFYIGDYMDAANPNAPEKAYLLPLMNASSFLGRILGGLAADSTGPANITYPMTTLAGLLCLGTWAVTSSPPVLISFALLYGFCTGVFIAVLPAIIAQISPATKMGGRVGAFYSVCAIAQLVGSPIGGALIKDRHEKKDNNGNQVDDVSSDGYLGPILFAGTTILAGGIIIFISRLLHDRNLRAKY